MMDDMLREATREVAGLRAIMVIAMPDCLLYSSWTKEKETTFSVEDASGYFGDLVRANRQGLRSIGAWTDDMQVTIEGTDALVILRELNDHFVCCAFFDRTAALGMVRLQLKMLLERIKSALPRIDVEERPRGVRLVEFIERYSPDPHHALFRLATRTGISMDLLRDPARLDESQVAAVEEAGKRILGLDKIHV